MGKIKTGGIFKKKICGDLFGSKSGEGMVYASRNADFGSVVPTGGFKEIKEDKGRKMQTGEEKLSVFDSEMGYWSDSSESCGSDDGHSKVDRTNDRQRLAQTLNNWCIDTKNTSYMLDEGGLDKLIALSASNDRKIKKNCAQAFNRLCRDEKVRAMLLNRDVVSALVALAYTLKSPKRGLDCAEAMVKLTLIEGSEEILVNDGSVPAFMSLMSLGASEVAPICVAGLFNLTCAGEAGFHNAYKVIKSIVNLPFTDRIDPRPIIVKAMLNCALLYVGERAKRASCENNNEERSDVYYCFVASLLAGRSACRYRSHI